MEKSFFLFVLEFWIEFDWAWMGYEYLTVVALWPVTVLWMWTNRRIGRSMVRNNQQKTSSVVAGLSVENT